VSRRSEERPEVATDHGSKVVPEWWADEKYCYLRTTGRVTGKPHEIEIWFGVYDGRLYLISGGGERSDWVKNLRRDPNVYVRVGDDKKEATARVLKDSGSHLARWVLAAKYQGWREGRSLSGWAAEALLIEVALRG